MSERKPEKIQEYRRQSLEPEIAAMSVEIEDDEIPTLIVNIDDPAAKGAIKKVIGWLITVGGILEGVRQVTKPQIALAVAGSATAASVIAAVITESGGGVHTYNPPAAIQRTVGLYPSPVITGTASPTAKKTTPRATRPPRHARTPAGAVTPPPADRPAPETSTSRATVDPTRRSRTPSQVTESSPAQADGPLNASGQQTPEPTRPPKTPEPTGGPGPESPATEAAAGCGGLVAVDLDPLLDLCLLG